MFLYSCFLLQDHPKRWFLLCKSYTHSLWKNPPCVILNCTYTNLCDRKYHKENKIMKTKIKQIKNKLTQKYNFKYAMILAAVLTSIFWGLVFGGHYYYEKKVAEIQQESWEIGYFQGLNDGDVNCQVEKENAKILSKQKVLKELAKIESVNGKYRKILDTNNRYSLGLYHFQAHTVQDMYKRYYGKKITLDEAVAIAQNDELSTKLAYDAIFVKGEKFHWHNSMIKLNAKGLVAYTR